MADYTLEGPRWGTGPLGTAGGTITWAVDASVPASFDSVIASAFADWSSHGNIQFQQVSSTATAQIDFSDGYIDGTDNVLGQTNYSYSGNSLVAADIEFDSGEGWHASGSQVVSSDGVNLFAVALHEIGHSIGLDHYNLTPAIMNADLNPSVTDLQPSDIDGEQALYGPAAATTSGNETHFGQVTTSPTSAGGEVYGLYEALLGRSPDPVGLETWTQDVNNGLSMHDLAQTLLDSPEGQARSGSESNAAFLQQLYGSALGRPIDPTGAASWGAALNGGESRADVANAVAFSPEGESHLGQALSSGLFVPDASAASVARLYYGILDRAPDATGLDNWTHAVRDGMSLTSVATSFLNSAEFAAEGAVSNASFVTTLYEGALGRAPDAGGLASWTGALGGGTSRAAVALGIAESPEAQGHLVASVETGWKLG